MSEAKEVEFEEDLDGHQILENYRDAAHMHCLEGETGVMWFEKLCEALGYRNLGFKFGDPISSFLVDNSGALEAIMEWIAENMSNTEWRENLIDATERVTGTEAAENN